MDEKARFRAFVVVIVAVLAVGAVYAIATVATGADVAWTLVALVILVSMALVMLAVVLKKRQELKAGFPGEDERSRPIRWRAGYWAYFASLYFLFFVSMIQALLEDRQVVSLPTAEWGMIYVAVMGMIFLVALAVLNRKGVSA